MHSGILRADAPPRGSAELGCGALNNVINFSDTRSGAGTSGALQLGGNGVDASGRRKRAS